MVSSQHSISPLWKKDIYPLIWLALPLILTNFAYVALTTIDIIVLGSLGVKEVAAGGLAIALFNQLRTTGTGLITSVSNLVAEANARKDQAAIQALLFGGFFWATIAGLVFIALILLLEKPLLWLGQDAEVAKLTIHFLIIVAPGLLPCLWFQALRHFTVGLKYPGPLLAITLISIALTLGLNYVLVFGKFGLPALGITGVAVTTSIVFLLSFLMFLAVVIQNKTLSGYFKFRQMHFDKAAICSIWKLGLPIAGTYASEAGFFSVLTLLIGTMGVNALAAQTVINQIVYIVFMISAGISHSTSILISEAYSIQDYQRAKRLGYIGLMLGCLSMLIIAIPYLITPEAIISWFISAEQSSNAPIMSMMITGLAIAALLQLFDALQNIGNGILRGIGDTVRPFQLSIIGYWCVGLPTAYGLGVVLSLDVYGVWFGLMIGLAFNALLLIYSFNRRLNKLSKVQAAEVKAQTSNTKASAAAQKPKAQTLKSTQTETTESARAVEQNSNYAQPILRPQIARLPIYDAGADPEQIKAKYQLSAISKLSNNENPLGISSKVSESLSSKLALLARYPDPCSNALQQKLAEQLNVSQQQIIIGNGSENILELLCLAFLNNDDRVITQSPCFGLHEIFPLMMGAKVEKIAHAADFAINTSSWVAALQQPTKILFISNPSNPVGCIFNHQQLLTVINAASYDTLIVIDEAYYEYAISDPDYPDALQLLRTQKRAWMVLRTFSKAYALAGLRVGYGIASDRSIIDALDRVRAPYNINFLAQKAAIVALDDKAHLTQSVGYIASERERILHRLRREGFAVADSYTNFLFIDTAKDAAEVAEKLAEQGIIVKAWREQGYNSFIRVSIGLKAENERFIQAFLSIAS